MILFTRLVYITTWAAVFSTSISTELWTGDAPAMYIYLLLWLAV